MHERIEYDFIKEFKYFDNFLILFRNSIQLYFKQFEKRCVVFKLIRKQKQRRVSPYIHNRTSSIS